MRYNVKSLIKWLFYKNISFFMLIGIRSTNNKKGRPTAYFARPSYNIIAKNKLMQITKITVIK